MAGASPKPRKSREDRPRHAALRATHARFLCRPLLQPAVGWPALDSCGGVDLARWEQLNERAPRYAASSLVGAAAALVLAFQVMRGWPWLAGSGAAAQARFFFRKSIVRCHASCAAALS